MRRIALALAVALAAAACKDPETAAALAKEQAAQQAMEQGKSALLSGEYERAIGQFKAAASNAPTDPGPWLALADAYKQIGNDAAAVLALKQAESLTAGDDP